MRLVRRNKRHGFTLVELLVAIAIPAHSAHPNTSRLTYTLSMGENTIHIDLK